MYVYTYIRRPHKALEGVLLRGARPISQLTSKSGFMKSSPGKWGTGTPLKQPRIRHLSPAAYACVSIRMRQHTHASAYVSIRKPRIRHLSSAACACVSIRIRQHTSALQQARVRHFSRCRSMAEASVSLLASSSEMVCFRYLPEGASLYGSFHGQQICDAPVSIRQHPSASVSIREHTCIPATDPCARYL